MGSAKVSQGSTHGEANDKCIIHDKYSYLFLFASLFQRLVVLAVLWWGSGEGNLIRIINKFDHINWPSKQMKF